MSVSNPLLKQLKANILTLTKPSLNGEPNYALPTSAQCGDDNTASKVSSTNKGQFTTLPSSIEGPDKSSSDPLTNVFTSDQLSTGRTNRPVSNRAIFPSVTDTTVGLQSLCFSIESVLINGIQGGSHTPFGYTKHTYWQWLSALKDRCGASFRKQVEEVQKNSSVRGSVGRGRLLIRHLLVYDCLHAPLSMLNIETNSSCYSKTSILGDEILREILLSLVRQIDIIHFSLDLSNCEFLEDSWILPTRKVATLNTCLELGLHLGHVNGRCVIVAVEPGSAAHSTSCIHAGDVIVSIGDTTIRGFNKTKVSNLMKSTTNSSTSVQLTLLQGVSPNRHIFPPLTPILRQLNLSTDDLLERRFEDLTPLESITTSMNAVSTKGAADPAGSIVFVGAANIGSRGDIGYIDIGVAAVLEKLKQAEHKYKTVNVSIATGEIGVKVMDTKGKVLLNHSYTEISACGRKEDCPLYFAYIAGDTTCSLSANFTCYVFKAPNLEECTDLLLTLADGFHRTHWAV